jgi:TonB family protein
MAKRYTLRTVLTVLTIPALAGLMGVSYAQALASVDSTGQPPDQPAIRQQMMQPASESVESDSRFTSSLAGGMVQGGRLLRMTRPSYPSSARRAFVSGVVTVEAVIGKDGHVVETSVLHGPYPLRRVAEHALKRWRYEPTLLDGKPVERVAEVNFTFVLGRH